jgi:3',5'-cyclic AMP phosphodiesterase CpdA
LRALALLLLSLSACALPSQPPATFRFLEINDLHLLDDASMAYPAKVVGAMNEEDAALVLVCGDLATDGKEQELRRARAVLEKLRIPWFVVPGNHDALSAGDRDEELFRRMFDLRETTYTFERGGLHFVAIDPGCGHDYTRNAVRAGPLAQLRRIAGALPGCARRPLLPLPLRSGRDLSDTQRRRGARGLLASAPPGRGERPLARQHGEARSRGAVHDDGDVQFDPAESRQDRRERLSDLHRAQRPRDRDRVQNRRALKPNTPPFVVRAAYSTTRMWSSFSIFSVTVPGAPVMRS